MKAKNTSKCIRVCVTEWTKREIYKNVPKQHSERNWREKDKKKVMGGGHTLAYHLNNKLQPFLKKDDVKGWTMGKKLW